MRVNFSAVIRDLDGEPVMTAKKGARVDAQGNALVQSDQEPMTLARAAVVGLMSARQQPESPEAYTDCLALALRVRQGGEQDITEAEKAVA